MRFRCVGLRGFYLNLVKYNSGLELSVCRGLFRMFCFLCGMYTFGW